MSSGFFSNTSTDGLDVSFFTGNSATAALLSSPFTGQLTQNGNAVSTTNRLPVDVAFPAAQPFPAGFRITNTDGQPIPVRIIASDVEFGGGGASAGETFDGIIKNTTSKPVPVQFVGTPSVAIDGTVPVTGSITLAGVNHASGAVPVTLASVPTHGVTVQGTASVAITGTPSVAIAGTVPVSIAAKVKIDDTTPLNVNASLTLPDVQRVQVENPQTSVSITGTPTVNANVTFPSTQNVAGTVAVSTLPNVTLTNPFDGVLRLAGQAVSTSNRLPVNVTFPSTQDITGTVTVANPQTSVSITGTPTVNANVMFPDTQNVVGFVAISNEVLINSSTPVRVQVDNPQTSVSITGTPTVAVSGPVTVNTASGVTTTDRSGTLTTGGTAQVLAPADAARRGGWIQNNSTGDLWVSEVGTATMGGSALRIPAGVAYEWPSHGIPVTALSIIGATTGQAFSARTW